MLHHGSNSDRRHDQDRRKVKLRELEMRNSDPCGGSNLGKIQNRRAVRVFDAGRVHNQRSAVSNHDAHQNGDDFEHSLSPDIENNDNHKSDQCEKPVGLRIADRGAREGQADADNNRSGHNRRKEMHDLLYAHKADDQSEQQIQKTRNHNAAARIGCLVIDAHVLVDAGLQIRNSGKTAEKCERRTQKCRNFELRAHMKQQCADTGAEQSNSYCKPGRRRLPAGIPEIARNQNGNKNRSPEHGKHVLQTQNQHSGHTQFPGVPDRPVRSSHNNFLL